MGKQRVVCGYLAQGEIAVGDDCRQEIVEIVCNSTCQTANDLHLLSLTKLRFQLCLMCYISLHRDIIDNGARRIANGRNCCLFFEKRTALRSVDKSALPDVALAQRSPHLLIEG